MATYKGCLLFNSSEKVVQSTNAWVITRGINSGVTKSIGEAFRGITTRDPKTGNSRACIGISPWHNVANRWDLQEVDKIIKYDIPKGISSHGTYLDYNHTHFLLVDDNYDEKFGTKIDFNTSLETHIRNQRCKGTQFFYENLCAS